MRPPPVAALFGAVNSPFGRALAIELATHYCLALCDANPHALENTVDECFATSEASPFKVSAHGVDVYDLASVRACAEEIEADHARVDLCVVLAARGDGVPACEIGQARFARLLAREVQPLFHVLRVFLPLLAKAPSIEPPASRPANVPVDFKLVVPALAAAAAAAPRTKRPSAFLLVLSPDVTHPRPHRALPCAIQRAWASAVESLNTQNDGRLVVGLTAVVGSLHGESPPWWRAPAAEFGALPDDDDDDDNGNDDAAAWALERSSAQNGSYGAPEQRQSVADTLVSLTPRVFARRHSRSRADLSGALTAEAQQALLRETSSTAPSFRAPECLTPVEAALWVLSGLNQGRAMALVGYDVQVVSALPLAFRSLLFEQRAQPKSPRRPSNVNPAQPRAQMRAMDDQRAHSRRLAALVPVGALLFALLPLAVAVVLWVVLAMAVLDLVTAWMVRAAVGAVLRITPLRRLAAVRRLVAEARKAEQSAYAGVHAAARKLKVA